MPILVNPAPLIAPERVRLLAWVSTVPALVNAMSLAALSPLAPACKVTPAAPKVKAPVPRAVLLLMLILPALIVVPPL